MSQRRNRKRGPLDLSPAERQRRREDAIARRHPETGLLVSKDVEKARLAQQEEHRRNISWLVNGWGNASGLNEAQLLPAIQARGFESVEAYCEHLGVEYDPPWKRYHPDWDGPPDLDTALELRAAAHPQMDEYEADDTDKRLAAIAASGDGLPAKLAAKLLVLDALASE